ncbi:odorant receptor 82a-like [Harpegnathos saltator]|uniref:odorant receptor 82a-like n=1 Tax=Harpegnathos saltator TaxID=610380 RepID=UPI000948C3F2|nr:odorant receptor 82a-like [Harpegnathos saltator]
MLPTSTIDGPMGFTLRLIGIWPDCLCKNLLPILWTIVMLASQIFQYWYLFTHIGSDTLNDLAHSLSLCFSNSLLFLKLNILWWNRRIIFDIFATMAEDWNICTSINLKTKMINKAILSHRFSKCIIGAYTMPLLLLGATNILIQKSASFDQADEERQLFIQMNLPFVYSVSPTYEIVMVTQFLLQYTLALMAGMLNVFIVTLILHIAGQIEIMCQRLLEILVAEDEYESHIATLRALVIKHQRIIIFADNIENVFCYAALLQFLSNTLVICFLGFWIVTSLDSNGVLMTAISYYVIVIMEAFILCYSGEYLSSKSRSLTESAYASLWYELKPAQSRMLMLLILRSQKQLTVTAGKFVDLSLESFTSIIKASASYVSVLHAMY